MAASLPSLSLSDIMHPLSPPPSLTIPTKSSTPPPHPRTSTPEPLEPAEIEEMRRKVISMGWGDASKGKQNAGGGEQELADMLLRLTHPASLPQASQLHAQAETIANLIQQREFLVKRSMDERERWDSERESWARAAQALILQRRKEMMQADKDDIITGQYSGVTADASTQRIQEFERMNAVLQSDKTILQQKLTDAQTRLATLESELAQLRPLLLMQPFALVHSHPTGQHGWTASIPKLTPSRSGRTQEAADVFDSDDESTLPHLQPRPQFRNPVLRPVGSDQQQTTLQPPFPSSPNKGDYYRRREVVPSSVQYPTSATKPGRRKAAVSQVPATSRPLFSDARAEHLLLAARKIGMQRATFLSGAFDHLQNPPSESPLPQSRQRRPPTSPSKLRTPKTPRRNAVANTPLLTRTPLGVSPGQPRTPLQSLLSAAQSVLSAPGSLSTEPPESPLAKRRKLDHSATLFKKTDTPLNKKDKGKGRDVRKDVVEVKELEKTPADITKVKSALDLLADEAEARGTRPPSAEAEADAEGDEDSQHDVDMEDDTVEQLGDTELLDGQQTRKKGKDKAVEDSRPEEAEAEERRHEVDDTADHSQSQETVLESQGAETSQMSTSFNHPLPAPIQATQTTTGNGTNSPLNRTKEQSSEGISMLAPPIDLTPRASASRSPAPSDVQHASAASRNGSRAQSVERFSSLDSGSGSFTTFSLERPLPLAAGLSVLASSLSREGVEDQGPSVLLTSRIDGVKFITEDPPRRTRSPYIKWTKEEDELLAKAVAKYGQKWDLVQKELPSRGYHQVRQRWLRKLGVFDGGKIDLASSETNAAAEFLNMATAPPTDTEADTQSQSAATTCTKSGVVPFVCDKSLPVLGLPVSGSGVVVGSDDLDEDAEADIDMGEEMEPMHAEP